VKLGADASVAAGPVGRDLSAETDATLRADILSYSRARGAFAGIALEGSTIRPDGGANGRFTARRFRQGRLCVPGRLQFRLPPGNWFRH
jgi:lipid-binding SYLF domain-containing protein